MKKLSFDFLFGVLSILIGLIFLIYDLFDLIIIEFYSDDIAYLYVKPLSVRVTQWAYFLLLIFSGYWLIKKYRITWQSYQLAAIVIIIERFSIFFIFFELFNGKIFYNLIVPIIFAILILVYTNSIRMKNLCKIKKTYNFRFLMIMLGLGAFLTFFPKMIMYLVY